MSLSRAFNLFRQTKTVNPALKAILNGGISRTSIIIKQQVRNNSDGWVYRTSGHHHNESYRKFADFSMALTWWWILWHAYYEYDLVLGEWDVPNPKSWTNAELGVPDD